MATCPNCNSNNAKVHENLPNSRAVYECRDCGARWRDDKPETTTIEKDDITEGNKRTITTRSLNITSIEELIAYSKVDLDIWEVHKPRIKTSEVTISGKNTDTGKPETYTNYHVSCEFIRKEEKANPTQTLDAFIHLASQHAPVYESIQFQPKPHPTMLELALYDLHYGQMSDLLETGQAYNPKIAGELVQALIDYYLGEFRMGRVDTILLPVGNDFYNVNGLSKTTFGGTPQTEAPHWLKTYTTGVDIWVHVIDRLRQYAPVHVLWIPGNHDTESSFHLCHSLYCWYHNCDNVFVDTSPTYRKVFQYGNTLLAFTHGHLESKGVNAPLSMAVEWPLLWAQTKYREIHKGHWHHVQVKEDQTVMERILSTLVALDDYHKHKGYNHLRQAMAFEWSFDAGMKTQLPCSLEMLTA